MEQPSTVDVLDNICNAIRLLEDNEEYFEKLFTLQSLTDKKIDYWLHYIELEPVKVTESYRIIKELHKLRTERRIFKNQLELMKVFHDNENKLCNEGNRKILLNQIHKTRNKQQNAQYGYDAYTKEEADEILGRKSSDNNEVI